MDSVVYVNAIPGRELLPRMKARLGTPKAITAAAHKLARIVYSLVIAGVEHSPHAGQFVKIPRHRILHKLIL